MDAIIGKTISILSYAQVRYVGIIKSFDGEKKLITISNVRIFGTEDRIKDSNKWILPTSGIIPLMELHGDSVSMLKIIDEDVNTLVPTLLPEMINPVPEEVKEEVKEETINDNNTDKKPIDGKNIKKEDTDFDFTSNNEKFELNKDDELNEFKYSYNKKSSFFDDLSSSVNESNNERMTWMQEKSLNEDTFGESSVNNFRNNRGRGRGNRGRGRGRGRGNRGRGGRGNRGDHNNNNNNNNNSYNNQPEWMF